MSERIVDNPANHGWVEENGKWVWGASGGSGGGGSIADGDTEGQITTWSGTEWTPEGAVVIDANGNVGIGTNAPAVRLDVSGGLIRAARGGGEADTSYGALQFTVDGTQHAMIATENSFNLKFITENTERMRIDATGRVGIGGTPSRSTKDIEEEAEATLRNWDSKDKKPTKAELIKQLTERAIGGGTAKLQVAGDGYFSGTVNAQKFVGDGSGLTGISAGGNYVPLTGNSTVNGTITATDFIATSDERLKDDISPLPVGLIDDIKPVQWNWKDGSGKSAGVIAQQLQAIGLDDFVNEDADGNLGVNYNALVGVLLAEVISLKAEVESLK